jgi:hypothetical protein
MSRKKSNASGLTSLLDILFSTFGAVIVMTIIFAARALSPPIDLTNQLEISCQLIHQGGTMLQHNPQFKIWLKKAESSSGKQKQVSVPSTWEMTEKERSYRYFEKLEPGLYQVKIELGESLPLGGHYDAKCQLLGKICHRKPDLCKPQTHSLVEEVPFGLTGQNYFLPRVEPIILFENIEITPET